MKMGGKELAEYFTVVMEELKKSDPELYEAMEIFRQTDAQYKEVVKVLEQIKPVQTVETVASTKEWSENGNLSISIR